MKKLLVWMMACCMISGNLLTAQTAGDYRSNGSGNWTSTATWQTYSGSEWQEAGEAPNSASGVVTILNGHTVTVNSTLTIDQTVVAEGGTLTVDLGSSESLTVNNGSGDDLTVNGTLNLSHVISNGGNGLTGTGKTVINGICNWNSGHITSTDFNISSSGVMNMEGSGECRINWDGVINNAGTVNFAKSSVAFVMYYRGTFNNLDGGVFEATTNESIYHRNDLSSGNMPEFNNAGTFRKKTGTGTTTIYKMDFNNTGTVDVQSGTLKFTAYARGTHTGTFTVASGATILTDEYSYHDFNEGSEINGAGIFEITSDHISVNGTTNGTVIGPDVTFKLSQIDNSKKSVMTGAGKLTINGTFEWTTTGNFNTGTIIVGEEGNLNISGDNQKTYYYSNGANLLQNYGTITWSGTGAIGGGGKTIQNKSTGVIDIQNNATLDANSGAYTVVNDGLIKKTAGSGTSRFSANLTNNGTLQIDTGTLDLYYSTLTNYDYNSGHPRLNGGVYDLQGKFKLNTSTPIEVNNADIILNGSESGIILLNDSNALANLAAITSDGSLTLRNSRDFTSGASVFDNYGTLDCGTNVFSNSGNFKNWDYAWLILGSTDGITSSGSSGNIQSSGSRTFHTVGKYHYNGSSAQVTGSGLPTTVRHLTIENSSGVTLSSSIAAATYLTLSEGALITGSNTLTLGSSAESVGTLTHTDGKIIGNFKRWLAASTVDDVLFPMGTADYDRPVNLSYSSAPASGGTLTASFTVSNPGSSGLPLSDGDYTVDAVNADGYWSLTAADGLSGGTYDLDIGADGFGDIADYRTLRILKRANSESAWTLDGSHIAGTGSNDNPVLHRSGLSGFSEFAVGSNSGDIPLPITLASFEALAVNGCVFVTWVTESESENAHFLLYRDGELLAQIAGAGTTSEPHSYAWTDCYVVPGRTYSYQLADVSFDGEETKHARIEVEIEAEGIAQDYNIGAAYPNPFNPVTLVPLILTKEAMVTATLYDLAGRPLRELQNGTLAAGSHELKIDGTNLSTGIYFVHVNIYGAVQVQKIVLMK
ncbi:MAG: T9SS type A sorting domain-containing protein [Candidatus Marinimicrobia bacterium]|nr:T9SS type A sorting domain-containing protein [Candidatus Neomarinimicrobiota bacterium]